MEDQRRSAPVAAGLGSALLVSALLVFSCTQQDTTGLKTKTDTTAGVKTPADSATVTPVDTTTKSPVDTTVTVPPPTTPAIPTAGVPYNPLSRHWSPIRLQVSDYRIQYQQDASVRATEFQWTAAHLDNVTLDASDPKSVPAYRQNNPSAKLFRYALNWTVITPGQESENNSTTYTNDMKTWYASHPQYQLENAFLHDASACPSGTPKTASCRLTFKVWTQQRWAVNPGDPGLRAYQSQRLANYAADADGVFLDEHGSGDIEDKLKSASITEYPNWSNYQHDMLGLLSAIRSALGSDKQVDINTATYIGTWDGQMTAAAGGAHQEGADDPWSADLESRWTYAEARIAAGSALDFTRGGTMPSSYTKGNADTPTNRASMFQLASYYMIVPSPPDLLRYGLNLKWDSPYSTQWFKPLEIDVGQPTTPRHIAGDGTDPAGHHYRVWAREFQRALVFVRPVIDWSSQDYTDAGALTITLPPGDKYLLVNPDGTLGAPTDRVTLRASEAAILLKQSSVSP